MKNKMRKSVSALLLVAAIAVTQIPVPEAAASTSDFLVDNNTLIEYKGTDSTVSVSASMKTIGESAFAGNLSVSNVTMKDGVTRIKDGAFSNCTNLSKVVIPASVTEIGPSAFAGCSNLKQITIDAKNENYICTDGVLYNKDKRKIIQVLAGRTTKSYTMPSTVERIAPFAFWGCKNLESIKLNDRIEEIEPYAFSNFTGLKSISIPGNVRSIDIKAFEDCINLKETSIPPSVTRIHDTAFDGCKKLLIQSEEGTVAYDFYEAFDKSNVADAEYEDNETTVSANEVEETKDYSSANVDNIEANKYIEDAPDSEAVMGRTQIVSGEAIVFVDGDKTRVQQGELEPYPYATTESMTVSGADSIAEEEDGSENKSTLIYGDTIANRAYYRDAALTSFDLPIDIKNIGDFAFARSSLESINIPNGVQKIGYGAFYHCDNLTDVTIPKSITEIEPAAFSNTKWLNDWRNSGDVNDFLVVGDGILIAYKGNSEKVTIPANVNKIGPEVFQNHTEITLVTLTDYIKEIGEDAFNGCTSLTTIASGNGLVKIKDRAFYNCPIATIRIPASVKELGLQAFGCDQENADNHTVVFQGNTLPKVSYEKTATRYSNEDYRNEVFKNVPVAVIGAGVTEFDETVLDDDYLGFSGVMCKIVKEPTSTQKGKAAIKKVFLTDTGYPADVPDSIWVHGKEYEIAEVASDAFPEFELPESLRDITDDTDDVKDSDGADDAAVSTEDENTETAEPAEGEVRQEQEDVTEEKEDQSGDENAGNIEEVDSSETGIKLHIAKEDFKNSSVLMAALREVPDQTYQVFLEEAQNDTLKNRVSELFGTATESNFMPFDLSMKDGTGTIPITKLGKQRLTIRIPMPKEWIDTPVIAVCLDENGQLEAISCKQNEVSGTAYAVFEASHFSPYALYQGDNVPQEFKDELDGKIEMRKGLAYRKDLGNKDQSPDTGDSIHPKWFLAIGLLALATFLFFKKDKRKTKA